MKAPGTKRLELKYDEPPSNFAFKFNLRRYKMAIIDLTGQMEEATLIPGVTIKVGRCRLTLSTHVESAWN